MFFFYGLLCSLHYQLEKAVYSYKKKNPEKAVVYTGLLNPSQLRIKQISVDAIFIRFYVKTCGTYHLKKFKHFSSSLYVMPFDCDLILCTQSLFAYKLLYLFM